MCQIRRQIGQMRQMRQMAYENIEYIFLQIWSRLNAGPAYLKTTA